MRFSHHKFDINLQFYILLTGSISSNHVFFIFGFLCAIVYGHVE